MMKWITGILLVARGLCGSLEGVHSLCERGDARDEGSPILCKSVTMMVSAGMRIIAGALGG